TNNVVAVGDLLPHRLVRSEAVAALVDIAEVHRLAEHDRALIRLLLAGEHAEEGGLPGAVRADDAHDAGRRELEGEILDEERLVVAFAEAFDIDDVLAEPLARRDDDLRLAGRALLVALEELVIGTDAGLRFRLSGAWARGNPFALAGEST